MIKNYAEALRLFKDEHYETCGQAAKQLINDSRVPPYMIIKACMLIICATDDWQEAEYYLHGAGHVEGMARDLTPVETSSAETEATFELIRKGLADLD